MIFVQNANGSQNGLWFVEQADHHITPQTYQMKLKLGRDSIGATTSLSVVPNYALPSKSVLVSGWWKATTAA
jgi:hypothetical protein